MDEQAEKKIPYRQMQQTEQKIKSFIKKHQMIRHGDQVIIGVSGGADSMCLLLVLLKLQEELEYEACVLHVEHGIRGADSLRDAAFVRHFCAQRSIECHICHYNVPEYARVHRMGEEEAGRHLRYEALRAQKKAYPGRDVKIAVAHHQGDNAETMLFHLARGTGILGLAAIAPVNGDLIRPLLCIGRSEIEAYLTACGQPFCEDATNGEEVYSRNRLRRQALPALHKVNSRAEEHMYETASQLRELHEYLKEQAQEAYKACCHTIEDGVEVNKERFLQQHPLIQKELLHRLLCQLAKNSKDLARVHIDSLRELFDRQNGRQVQLPYGIRAVRVYEGVQLVREGNEQSVAGGIGKNQFTFRLVEANSDQMSQISKNKYTKCFDYDKIKHGFCVRNRQPGDYLSVDENGCRQKLKKYLINEKVPAKERDRLLLLADGDHIMWVVGYRISSYYKVDKHTRKILEVTFYGGKEDEATDSGNDFGGRSKCTD